MEAPLTQDLNDRDDTYEFERKKEIAQMVEVMHVSMSSSSCFWWVMCTDMIVSL